MQHGGKARTALVVIIAMLGAGLPTFLASEAPAAATTPPSGGGAVTSAFTGGAMQLDTPMTGDLDSRGDIDTWTLTVASGVTVVPDVSAGNDTTRHWHLRDDAGRTIFDGQLWSMSPVYLAPADAAHPYVLTVSANGQGSADP
jgi:hypothetical protein